MFKKFFPVWLVFISLALQAETWQFEGDAVFDLGRMNRENLFRQWLPEELPDGRTPQVSGYFVMYRHEGLTYYFGP
ncbi:MAG: hypothetical protein ACO3NW_07915, partial [Kiritimatiellia bacterium]